MLMAGQAGLVCYGARTVWGFWQLPSVPEYVVLHGLSLD